MMVLEARTGVVRLPAGRDRSAGLMSGILTGGRQYWLVGNEVRCRIGSRQEFVASSRTAAASRAVKRPTATRRRGLLRHPRKAQSYAIMI